MSKLRPCPFCGGDKIVNDDAPGTFGESLVHYGVRCELCSASFWHPGIEFKCEEKPGIDWNTRPVEDRLRDERDELWMKLAKVTAWTEQNCGTLPTALSRILSDTPAPLAVVEGKVKYSEGDKTNVPSD